MTVLQLRKAFEADYYQRHDLEGCLDRRGQALFNFVYKIDPGIDPDKETEDPYYLDANMEDFYAYLEKRWNTG